MTDLHQRCEPMRYVRRALLNPFAQGRFLRSFPTRITNPGAFPHLAYFPRLGICYNRIKKNGNTSVVLLLSKFETGLDKPRKETKRALLSLGDLPLPEMMRLGRYRYCVVTRDPYTRVLSAFLEKFRLEEFQRTYGPFDLTPNGFGAFLQWLENGGLGQNRHWDLQSKITLWPLRDFDHVVRLESFATDFSRVLAASGLEVDSSLLSQVLPQDVDKRTDATKRADEYYSPERRALVARLFDADFEAMGYSR